MAMIAAAHDISGIGRCSLVTAISVLGAMGHQCCPLPTAVLSQQTGLAPYSYLDFTPHLDDYLKCWRDISFTPDLVFTGFLGSGRQPEILSGYLDEIPGCMLVVDPVMADDGALYPCFTKDFVDKMRCIARRANILTPNATELLLLAGKSPDALFPQKDEEILALASTLEAIPSQQIVVTGVTLGERSAENLIVNLREGRVGHLHCSHNGVSYSGSGDLFASVMCGGIALGVPLSKAIDMAAAFVALVAGSMPERTDPRYGLAFEEHMPELIKIAEECRNYAK